MEVHNTRKINGNDKKETKTRWIFNTFNIFNLIQILPLWLDAQVKVSTKYKKFICDKSNLIQFVFATIPILESFGNV